MSGVVYSTWLDQPVSDGLLRVKRPPLRFWLLCNTSGEKVKESPMGLNATVGKKLGARPRPASTVPKAPDRLMLASRENRVSPSNRPAAPVVMRMKPVKAKLALRPPPRSSVPFMPHHEVVMPLVPTTFECLASPARRMEPTYASASPMS